MSRRSLISEYTENIHVLIKLRGDGFIIIDVTFNVVFFKSKTADSNQPKIKEIHLKYSRLLRLYLTVPVTTATAERSFSVMNRMKTCMRSTMTQTRLNSVFLTHIYKEKTDSIDLNSICATFASKNDQRKLFFGVF
jgi:predicted GTPase